MERKKPQKLNFALAVSNGDYFEPPPMSAQSNQAQNLNDSLFFKYASSIIQVVSEDKLDSSCAGMGSQHPRNAIFEISQVKEFEGGGGSAAGSICREQNNYNNMAAKMKKKGPNRKALAYNFSNLTLLSQKIYSIFLRPLKNALETLKTSSINSDYNKTKKEIKRASFYSGYTTSTSNEEKTSKRNSKRMTEERRTQIHEQGANSIKGWIEFKVLLLSSHAYSSIKEYASKCPHQAALGISQVSTIKNQPMEKFYLTEYQHDNSISIARELPHNISESLVYTADQNFEFTQKEVTLTTPEKFGSEDRLSTPPLPNIHMRKVNSNQQSFVETYKPKDHYYPQAKIAVSKEVIIPSVSRPIKLAQFEQRRYLEIRTNMYELPILGDHDIKNDRQRVIKDPSHLQDRFMRNQPQTSENVEVMVKQLKDACALLMSKPKASEHIFHAKQENHSKINKNNGSRALQPRKSDVDSKKLVSSNTGQAKQEKKDVQKIQNYYYFSDKTSPRASKAVPSSPSIHQQKKPIQQIKGVESILKSSSKPEKKRQKTVRIQESLVSQFMIEKNKQSLHPFSMKNNQQVQQNTYMLAYQPQNIQKRDERVKSRSKISILLPSQRKESPRLNLYHHVQSHRQENRPTAKPFDNDRQFNNPYGYPTSNQKPKSPNFVHTDKNMHSPMHSPVQPPKINQQTAFNYIQPAPTGPQRLVNQVKSNEQLKMQIQQPRVQQVVRNSPGKVMSPTYLINSQERRMMGAPSQMRHEEKKSFYSPQIPKDTYMLSPEKPYHPINEPPKLQTPVSIRRMHNDHDYFTKEVPNQPIRAINFNNNYYTSGPQSARPPSFAEPPRNVFQQEQAPRRQGYFERPPSSRQSCERAAIFANYSPLDSELESQQRSNHFSKNSSELSRPKSMNQKIFITLRKDK